MKFSRPITQQAFCAVVAALFSIGLSTDATAKGHSRHRSSSHKSHSSSSHHATASSKHRAASSHGNRTAIHVTVNPSSKPAQNAAGNTSTHQTPPESPAIGNDRRMPASKAAPQPNAPCFDEHGRVIDLSAARSSSTPVKCWPKANSAATDR